MSPSLVLAAPAESSPPSDAEAIFRRGQAKYETADYNGAIDLWTEAYGLIDSTPENASIKAVLIFNLAQAHAKAYELDEDLIHLKQAQRLLASFRDNLSLLYEDQEALAAEQARVETRLAEIEAQLAAIEAEPEPEPEPEPKPELEPEPPPPTIDPIEDPEKKPGKPLIITGGVMVGLGVGAAVVGAVGAVIGVTANDISGFSAFDFDAREDQFARGRTGNVLLIAGAVGAGLLIPTGAALLGVGISQNKRMNRASLSLSPNFAGSWGGGGGLTLSGRF